MVIGFVVVVVVAVVVVDEVGFVGFFVDVDFLADVDSADAVEVDADVDVTVEPPDEDTSVVETVVETVVAVVVVDDGAGSGEEVDAQPTHNAKHTHNIHDNSRRYMGVPSYRAYNSPVYCISYRFLG